RWPWETWSSGDSGVVYLPVRTPVNRTSATPHRSPGRKKSPKPGDGQHFADSNLDGPGAQRAGNEGAGQAHGTTEHGIVGLELAGQILVGEHLSYRFLDQYLESGLFQERAQVGPSEQMKVLVRLEMGP